MSTVEVYPSRQDGQGETCCVTRYSAYRGNERCETTSRNYTVRNPSRPRLSPGTIPHPASEGTEVKVNPESRRHRSSHYRRSSSPIRGQPVIIVDAPPSPHIAAHPLGNPGFSNQERRSHCTMANERPKKQVRIETPEETEERHRRTSKPSHAATPADERRGRAERGDSEDETRRLRRERLIEEANREISMRPTVPPHAGISCVRPSLDDMEENRTDQKWRPSTRKEMVVIERDGEDKRLIPTRVTIRARQIIIDLGG